MWTGICIIGAKGLGFIVLSRDTQIYGQELEEPGVEPSTLGFVDDCPTMVIRQGRPSFLLLWGMWEFSLPDGPV